MYNNKDNRLRGEIHEKIDSIFVSQQQYVDIAYCGYKVGYEKVSIPVPAKSKLLGLLDEESKKVLGDIDRKSMDTWTDNYGNLTKCIELIIRGQIGQDHLIMRMGGI